MQSPTPAEIVIAKCGGHKKVAELIGVDVSWVYRWTYPPERGGSGGQIPRKQQIKLLEKARAEKIDLTPADFFPKAA